MIVDARGHLCPVPSLRLQKALTKAPAGSVATLLATDPMARIDVPYLMASLGGRVIEITEAGNILTIRVELNGAPGAPTG